MNDFATRFDRWKRETWPTTKLVVITAALGALMLGAVHYVPHHHYVMDWHNAPAPASHG